MHIMLAATTRSCRSVVALGTAATARRTARVPRSRMAAARSGARSLTTANANATLATLKDSYDHVVVETVMPMPVPDATATRGGVGIIKLNRPKALNALCDALFADLIHAATALDKDARIGCLVLTSTSPKAFAAGADIAEMKDREFAAVHQSNMFAEWADLMRISKPVLCAVHGFALGGGCELAMTCDMILAADTAKFGQPEINLGVMPGAGGTQRLTAAIGKSKSMYANLTGEFISATDAERAGLVAKVVPDDQLQEEALRVATLIASKGALAVKMTKEAVNASLELPLTQGLRLERRLFHSLFATADQKEGMSAFLEKRKPEFKDD